MLNSRIKIVNANLAYGINKYKNIKRKLLTCNADIYFNKSCLEQKVTPKYANINIKTSKYSEAAKRTETQTRILRIKNEIKMLYKKKTILNKTLYTLHIKNANTCRNTWDIIAQNIDNTLENLMKIKYNNINKKLEKLKGNNIGNKQQHNHTFYQRVYNLSNTTFTNDEIALLSKGLKYNLHYKPKQWLKTLAIEADTAINLIAPHEQAYIRQTIANKLKILMNNERQTQSTKQESVEKKLIRKIRSKLKQNNLIVTKADKGNTLVIMQQNDYHQKVDEFITQNQFVKIEDNYTKKQQNTIKTTINQCKTIIKQNEKLRYQNMNPGTPHIHGTIKPSHHQVYQTRILKVATTDPLLTIEWSKHLV
jgi:hypothetical protein